MEKRATWLSHSQLEDSLPRDPAMGLSPGRFSAAAASLFPGDQEAAGAPEPVGWLCPARGGQSGAHAAGTALLPTARLQPEPDCALALGGWGACRAKVAGRRAGSVSRGRWRPPQTPRPGRLFSLRPLGAPRRGCSAPHLPRLPRPRMDPPAAASTPHPDRPTPVQPQPLREVVTPVLEGPRAEGAAAARSGQKHENGFDLERPEGPALSTRAFSPGGLV